MRLNEHTKRQIQLATRKWTNKLNNFTKQHNFVVMDYIPTLHANSLRVQIEEKQICGQIETRYLLNPLETNIPAEFKTRTNQLNRRRRIFVAQTLERQDEPEAIVYDNVYNIRQRGRQPLPNTTQWKSKVLGFVIVMPGSVENVDRFGSGVLPSGVTRIVMVCSIDVANLIVVRALLAKALLFLGTVPLAQGFARHVIMLTPNPIDLLQEIGFREFPQNIGYVFKEREHPVPKLFLNEDQWNRLMNINFSIGIYCGPSQRLNFYNQQWIPNERKRKTFCSKYKLGTDYRKGQKSIRYQEF